MTAWNEESEDQLISMIQERPPLFDITEKRYANRIVKTGLWREIENVLGFSEKELKRKWESLRTQYTRYRKLAPSGSSGAPKTGRQQWILTRLQFVEPFTRRKESTSNLTIPEPLVAAESPSDGSVGSIDETWTSSPELFDAESRPYTPLAESAINVRESTPAPLGEGPSTLSHSSTPRPPAKRTRRMLDDSASGAPENMLSYVSTLLEKLTGNGQLNDEIAVHSQVYEHRLRWLSCDMLPIFLHEVEKSYFKCLMEQTHGDETFRQFAHL